MNKTVNRIFASLLRKTNTIIHYALEKNRLYVAQNIDFKLKIIYPFKLTHQYKTAILPHWNISKVNSNFYCNTCPETS